MGTFLNGRACSDTLFHVLTREFDPPLKFEERACMPLAGGILQHGYQCGMIWGAAFAAGAQAHRLHGADPLAETKAILAAGRIVRSFRTMRGTVDCYDITHIDESSSTGQMITYFLLKGGTVGCFRMAARYASVADAEVEAVLREEPAEVPVARASCAAILAREMGASDVHAVMAAGLAGGIGLSGGACGALGAAIWLTSLKALQGGAKKLGFKDPGAAAVIDRFLRGSDFEFECSKIVGREFESIADHADYLRGGGCAKVIRALAAR